MAIKRNGVLIGEKQNKKIKIEVDDDSPSPPYLDEKLVIENVLTRLPAKDLGRFASVSKSWKDSILDDNKFAASHFTQNQNKRKLTFNLLNVLRKDDANRVVRSFFFNLHSSNPDDSNILYDFELFSEIATKGSVELVGNCNGLICVKCDSKSGFVKMTVMSWFRKKTLTLAHFTPKIKGVIKYLCHGFGFDSTSQRYRVVVIYTTKTTASDQGFICMVGTLGVRSWRKIVISPSEILPPPGRSSFPTRMEMTVSDLWEDTQRSATICGGDLLWRITIYSPDDDYAYYDDNDTHEIEMLLSFDIHNEKIQFIRLPNEGNSLIAAYAGEKGCIELRHYLLEFKGYPCVAHLQKIHITERVDTLSFGLRFIEYRFKVHLYILKDKVKQIWIKEESFDASFVEDSVEPDCVLRDPFDRYFNKTEHSNNHRGHPTRMFSFSDQVMLYWFDGGCLIFYNLRKKHHNVVNGILSCNKQIHYIFEAKIRGLPDPDSDYDVPECPCIDYQLHVQAENIISLKPFIP